MLPVQVVPGHLKTLAGPQNRTPLNKKKRNSGIFRCSAYRSDRCFYRRFLNISLRDGNTGTIKIPGEDSPGQPKTTAYKKKTLIAGSLTGV